MRYMSGDVLQTFLDVVSLEQRGRDVGQQRGLELAPCRVGGAPARTCGELADDHGGHDIDSEREPVRRVAERERVLRWKEEKIEREHRGDRYADREHHPEDDRDRQAGEEVENTEAEYWNESTDGEDRSRDDRDGAHADDRACEPSALSSHEKQDTAKAACASPLSRDPPTGVRPRSIRTPPDSVPDGRFAKTGVRPRAFRTR